MLKTAIISIYEFPEPSRIFNTIDGRIGVIFEPNMFYKLSSRYNIGEALKIVEKPMIHDLEEGQYLMYLCEVPLVEGSFCIFVSVGFGEVTVDLSNTICMNLSQDFEVDYDLTKQTYYLRPSEDL